MKNYVISEEILNDSIISKLLNKKISVTDETELHQLKNEKIILITDLNDEILSVARIKANSEHNLEEYLENSLRCIYEDEYNYIEDEIIPILNNGITLNFIESFEQGLGVGTEIVNMLKDKYPSIFLYARADAEEYWEKQGFFEIGDYNYVWSKEENL